MINLLKDYITRRSPEIIDAIHVEILKTVKELSIEEDGRLLDVGCWNGAWTLKFARQAGLKASNIYGIECIEPSLTQAGEKFNAHYCNLETDNFPYVDGYFDVVVCNQVFEHLKQIYKPIYEIWRVLKVGGSLIFSVPNLASIHNRVMLLFGAQPTSIRIMGPHVRGYTFKAAKDFLGFNDYFEIVREKGVGFYPFPEDMTRAICRLFPSYSHTSVFVARKNSSALPDWVAEMKVRNEQTNFF